MDWKRELVIAHLVKQKISEVDFQGLWQNTLPGVAVSENELNSAENSLGFSIDTQFRDFLLNANGWVAFHHSIDIFGVEDLTGGDRAHRAAELLRSLAPINQLCGVDESSFQPIAVSSDDIDVVLIVKPDFPGSGKVYWFAGGLVEVFSGFDDFFLAMVDYNRADYMEMTNEI